MRRILPLVAVFGLGTAYAHPSEQAALAALRTELESHPERRAKHLERAERLLRLQRPADALAAVQASGLRDARAHRLAGAAHLALGDRGAARRALDRAVARGPHDLAARWARADLAEADRDLPTAAADLQVVIAARGATPGAFLRLARVQSARGRVEAAQVTLQAGLNRTRAAPLRRALARAALRRADIDTALREANALMSAAKLPVEGLLLRAEVELARGRPDAAARDRRAALVAAEQMVARRGSAAALTYRAEAKAALGDTEGAREDAQAALRRAPAYPRAKAVLEASR